MVMAFPLAIMAWSAEMMAYAKSKDHKGGNYKKLNLSFENKLLGLPREVRQRMCKGMEDFVYELLTPMSLMRWIRPPGHLGHP